MTICTVIRSTASADRGPLGFEHSALCLATLSMLSARTVAVGAIRRVVVEEKGVDLVWLEEQRSDEAVGAVGWAG
jgi:hypothetical protein